MQWALAADWRTQAVCSLIISLNQGIRSDRAEADVSEYFNERQTRLMEVRRVCDRNCRKNHYYLELLHAILQTENMR